MPRSPEGRPSQLRPKTETLDEVISLEEPLKSEHAPRFTTNLLRETIHTIFTLESKLGSNTHRARQTRYTTSVLCSALGL
ncbi:hypothetical protein J6590_007873 [Homalodisca vitripennis]|nr:hypothetical protein J6590_007873 [Homalodisca vitripennis]